jgi:hypothetical protein
MKRTIKNVIMIVLIGVLCVGTYATMNYIKNQTPSMEMKGQMGQFGGKGQMEIPENGNDSSSDNNSTEVPSTDSDNSNAENNQQTPPQMAEGNRGGNQMSMLSYKYYAVFGVEGCLIAALVLYLLMSGFNKKTLKETFVNADKVLIYVLALIILTEAITAGDVFVTKRYFTNTQQMMDKPDNSSTEESTSANALEGIEIPMIEVS